MNRHCFVLRDGPLKLLTTQGEDEDYFLHFKDSSYSLKRRYWTNQLWKQLIGCASFASRYEAYHQESGGKLIVFPRDIKKWIEIVEFYNQHCSNK